MTLLADQHTASVDGSVAARVTVLLVAWHALVHVHRLPRLVSPAEFIADIRPIMTIARPVAAFATAMVAGLTVLATRFDRRVDATSERLSSLSPKTVELLDALAKLA